ncbi:manganese catalase family protein [Enterocloster bolteae]|uniref:ferritin-like domain-containing protein n=1 Tax=Enterocloster bolteae TaxID=208479 RepID=UPI001D08A6C7|nr:ferritin-like domain-containing protein [Enterocloster bolteae]MCB6924360.1 manganese catalase family protein [Enterocloster bolteae]MCQ4757179.1 manganese catalase family protein [Enterocloster bolteae]
MNNIQYNIRANPDSFPVAHSNWYPPVAVLEKNQQYAQILMADLASTASEMTTVHQYLYQSWTINDRHQNIRRVIQRIAIVEQHHFSIIGQLIHLLGGQPECRSSRPNSYWCGNMVSYSCELPAILSDNARSEQFAAQAYAAQSKEIKDPYVSKMLARLSLDEKLHYKIFSDYLSQIE